MRSRCFRRRCRWSGRNGRRRNRLRRCGSCRDGGRLGRNRHRLRTIRNRLRWRLALRRRRRRGRARPRRQIGRRQICRRRRTGNRTGARRHVLRCARRWRHAGEHHPAAELLRRLRGPGKVRHRRGRKARGPRRHRPTRNCTARNGNSGNLRYAVRRAVGAGRLLWETRLRKTGLRIALRRRSLLRKAGLRIALLGISRRLRISRRIVHPRRILRHWSAGNSGLRKACAGNGRTGYARWSVRRALTRTAGPGSRGRNRHDCRFSVPDACRQQPTPGSRSDP